ncbi:hypothetical protein [uncultured Roseibium sp.]|uniref:hypothetical protein n=1 Tax=uncultured Roseibium sp. TaxID=1936171 RepID=UPI0032172AE6
MRACLFLLLGLFLPVSALAQAQGSGLQPFIGCWVSESFAPTSLLADASKPESATLVREKMWLKIRMIEDTDYLVFSHIYEWDDENTYVLGPTYQNGAYNPQAGYLTFGFPNGGLDHVTMSGPDRLLYVHAKSATDKSAMSVRMLARLDCEDAGRMETELKQRQEMFQE